VPALELVMAMATRDDDARPAKGTAWR
jgi:hypothetical protein